MAILTKGHTFNSGDQVTSANLNNLADNATFASGSVDNSTTQLSSSGAIIVKDLGITSSKIQEGNVTRSKIEDVNNMKVLGNTSGTATAPQEVSILDDDTMSNASATTLATSESIKAYVDGAPNFTPSTYAGEESVTLPNGLIMKWGKKNCIADGDTTVSFGTGFPTACVNVQCTHNFSISTTSDAGVAAISVSQGGFDIRNGSGSAGDIFWQAIGY